MLAIIQAHELDRNGKPVFNRDGQRVALDEPRPKPEKLFSEGERHYIEVEAPRRTHDLRIQKAQQIQAEAVFLKLAEKD